MRRNVVWFLGPRRVEIREEQLPPRGPDSVQVRVQLTGVSAGTEMLLYRGELPNPASAEADPVIRGLQYPTPFGYCAVGRVTDADAEIGVQWKDRLVFAFQPHASSYVAPAAGLVAVPEDVSPDDAVFLANTETAVCLVHDAAPLLGERVLVLGQGIVGLLTAAMLADFPLACLVTADRHVLRREASAKLGVTEVLDPAAPDFGDRAMAFTQGAGFDTVLELTGNPSALDHAIANTSFSGRIIAGSWYGSQRSPLELGGRFHRSRIRILASQVSNIAPELSGRWNKPRRFEVAWDAIRRIGPARWITHRFPLEHAEDAFRVLDTSPESSIQVVLECSGTG